MLLLNYLGKVSVWSGGGVVVVAAGALLKVPTVTYT